MKEKITKLFQNLMRWFWKVNLSSIILPVPNKKILLFAILFSACAGQVARTPENLFVAPTLIPKVVVPTIEIQIKIESTRVASCEDNLEFVEDVTVSDGTRFPPNASIEKIWLVRNSGTCNWKSGYSLQLISSPNLGATLEQALFPARSGTEIEIRVDFIAPGAPGNYISKWQAFNPAGEPFGDLIFLDIWVDVSLASTAESSPSPVETEASSNGE